eukprot:8424718-Pyramimonas_sp.AAC.1
MWFVLSSARGVLRHGARAYLAVWVFRTVGHVAHRIDGLLVGLEEHGHHQSAPQQASPPADPRLMST